MQSLRRVGILRGGEHDYESSLYRGGNILSHIQESLSHKWKPYDILIDRRGVWHLRGLPIEPAALARQIDAVWSEAHPTYRETLRSFSIPTVGHGLFSHGLRESREMLKEHINKMEGIKMPRRIILPLYQEDIDGPRDKYAVSKAREIHSKFGAPWLVKSLSGNSLMAPHVANTFPGLVDAIYDGVLHQTSIIAEELIPGREVTMHSLGSFRGQNPYIFTPNGLVREEKEKLISFAKSLHSHIGAEYYSKLDFILHPRFGIYLYDINFSPDFSPDSDFSRHCENVGAKPHHIIEHILERVI